MAPKSLREQLEAAATPMVAAAHLPVLLDRSDVVVLVMSGQVDVFAAAVDTDGAPGPRRHLWRADGGSVLFGMPSQRGLAQRLLAAATPGSTMAEISLERFWALCAESSALDVASMLDSWVESLCAAISPGLAPRRFQELTPGGSVDLDQAGLVVRGGEGVTWARTMRGNVRLGGMEGFVLSESDGPAPLAPGMWLESEGATLLQGVATATLVEQGSARQHVESFHGLVPRVLARGAKVLEEEARDRFRARLEGDIAAGSQAVEALAALLAPKAAGVATTGVSADPLLAACEIVGRAQGIAFHAPAPSPPSSRPADRLAAIAKASRVRYRPVALRAEWWRTDSGALLAYRLGGADRRERTPVALLPTAPGAYELVDPSTGERTPVTPDLASSLDSKGVMFFRPFPERSVRGMDLLTFSFSHVRRDLVAVLMMGLAAGVLSLLTPIVTGYVFGTVIPGAEVGPLLQVTLGLLVAALSMSLFEITRSIAALRIEGRMDLDLQAAVWDRLLALPASFFRAFSVGDLASRAMGINAIRQTLSANAVTAILSAVFSLSSFALLFYYSRALALAATGLVLVLLLVVGTCTYLQVRRQRQIQALKGKTSGLVLQLLSAIAKLRVSAAERRAFRVWAAQFARQREVAFSARRIGNVLTAFNAGYPILTSMLIFAMVVQTFEGGDGEGLTVGSYLAFNAAFGQFLAAMLGMVGVFSGLLTAVPQYERMKPILETLPEVDTGKANPGELSGDLEVSHVSFRYKADGPLVLQDFSFRARPGEFVALVGPSGSGKSTTLRLVLGFDEPEAGAVLFDGKDLSGLDVQAVRRQIGVVLQSGKLMVGDIYTNIVGSSNLTIDDAWEAARMAGLDEDIKAMPMGMHTVVSEGAGTFSGGQKQRLMIARAIVNKPRIILFDEATSALDNRTQRTVSRSLEALRATRIVIAHRLSTIVHADRIYVVRAGHVAQSGRYEDLLHEQGPFADLARRQLV